MAATSSADRPWKVDVLLDRGRRLWERLSGPHQLASKGGLVRAASACMA